MLTKSVVEMVHDNAVKHGWWDSERSIEEVIALIHSEWSEALEEARAGRPDVYKFYEKDNYILPGTQDYQDLHSKPEGTAVELIDGCIRIFDLLGQYGMELLSPETGAELQMEELILLDNDEINMDVGKLVAYLHYLTSKIIAQMEGGEEIKVQCLAEALVLVFTWLHNRGLNPIGLLFEKHRYNLTRPYKHGKQF